MGFLRFDWPCEWQMWPAVQILIYLYERPVNLQNDYAYEKAKKNTGVNR